MQPLKNCKHPAITREVRAGGFIDQDKSIKVAYRHDSFQALGTFEVDNTDICSYLLYQQHTAYFADIDN